MRLDGFTLSLLRMALVGLCYLFLFAVIISVSRQFGPRLRRAARPLRLQVVRSEALVPGQSYDVPDEVTIGRAPGCTVNLPDVYVSDVHATVRRIGDTCTVNDLGSRNGTYVNGRRIQSPTRLKKGDALQVGQTTLELVQG